MDYYPFRFDVKRLRPLLQRDLYKKSDVVVRELAQNAHDAILRRAKTEKTFNPERDGRIDFLIDPVRGTLSVSDNGAGMSRDKILGVFRYYGRSDKDANDEVGTFGLGAKSIFAQADSFTIHTRSLESGTTVQVYATLEGVAFQDNPPTREAPGTTITVPSKMGEGDLKKYSEILDDYCRSVKVPICIEECGKDGKHLVSQKPPWRTKNIRIQGDGFEIYVALSNFDDGCRYIGEDDRFRVFVEGFFVSESRQFTDPRGIAINMNRKDMVNLTMSRDDVIRDEKYEKMLRTITDTIAAYAASTDFNSLRGLETHAAFIQWLSTRGNDSTLWKKLPDEMRTTIRALTGKVCMCPARDSAYRVKYSHQTTLLEALCTPKPKYFLFGKPRKIVEELATKKGAVIIYHECEQNRKTLKEILAKYGITAFSEGGKTRRYAVCTSVGEVSYFTSLQEIESSYSRSNGEKFFIFPDQGLRQRLQVITRRLSIYAVKLKKDETLGGNWIDLRKTAENKHVILRGSQVESKAVMRKARGAFVAPPEFFKFAQAAKKQPVIFTPDITSTCLMVIQGADVIGLDIMEDILEDVLPKEVSAEVQWWRLRDYDSYRTAASLAASLDWKNPYSSWLFTLACNSERMYAVASNPAWPRGGHFVEGDEDE